MLIAILDTDCEEMKKELLTVMCVKVRIKNLLNKMRDIFVFKIGGNERTERIYYQDKECDHHKRNLDLNVNQCTEDEFCEYRHLIPFDKLVIDTGFNIFMLLMEMQRYLPEEKDLDILQMNTKAISEYI